MRDPLRADDQSMFEDYKRRHQGYAAANRVKFSATQSVVILFMFTVLFRNIVAGLAGAAVALGFGLLLVAAGWSGATSD